SPAGRHRSIEPQRRAWDDARRGDHAARERRAPQKLPPTQRAASGGGPQRKTLRKTRKRKIVRRHAHTLPRTRQERQKISPILPRVRSYPDMGAVMSRARRLVFA